MILVRAQEAEKSPAEKVDGFGEEANDEKENAGRDLKSYLETKYHQISEEVQPSALN